MAVMPFDSRDRADHVTPSNATHVVDALLDALGHFAGERPALETLEHLVAPDASILVEDGDSCMRYARDAWLATLVAGDSMEDSIGHFFEPIESTVNEADGQSRVKAEVVERWTNGGAVERLEELAVEAVVGRAEDRPTIVALSVRRSSRPPPP